MLPRQPSALAAVDRESGERDGSRDGEGRGPLAQLFAIRREEWPLALLLSGYFFAVVTTFWILKPLKKGAFIAQFRAAGVPVFGVVLTAAQGELLAKVANMFVALGAAALFATLSRRLRREQLTLAFSAPLGLAFVYFAYASRAWSGASVFAFYLFGDLYSTLMIATFFAFANDSVDADAAKRLYGVVGLGGVAGGAFGSSVVVSAVKDLSVTTWMFVCLGIGLVVVALGRAAGARARARPRGGRAPSTREPSPARRVLASRYVVAILAIVALYEMVSTMMDFQFTSSVQWSLDGAAIPAHFAKVFAITNWAALLIQLLFTSLVMRKLGLTAALLVLPIAAALGSSAFLLAPTLLTGSALNLADNAFAYSINQSSKEVLYVPLDADERYAAKALVDMFVQRSAKALAVLLSLGISFWLSSRDGVRALSLATLALLGLWGVAAISAGRRFRALERARGVTQKDGGRRRTSASLADSRLAQ